MSLGLRDEERQQDQGLSPDVSGQKKNEMLLLLLVIIVIYKIPVMRTMAIIGPSEEHKKRRAGRQPLFALFMSASKNIGRNLSLIN